LLAGTTDLPDGSLIAYEVTHAVVAVGREDGTMLVTGGRFQRSVDLASWPPGRIEAWVAFQTILGTTVHQPPAVLQRFGQMGERLRGANVTKTGELRRVEQEQTFTLSGG
jgi:hypothetical protein